MAEATCCVDGCERPKRSPGVALCNAHYFRKRRTGDVGTPTIWDRTPTPCPVESCPRQIVTHGYCQKHYRRWRKHRDPEHVPPPNSGPRNGWWRGDDASYSAAHDRVRRLHGSASSHQCQACGQQAQHWSYDHSDPNEKQAAKGPYSTDPSHYRPLCVPCHKRSDLAYLRRSACHRCNAKDS
jgi:hypothetical protein